MFSVCLPTWLAFHTVSSSRPYVPCTVSQGIMLGLGIIMSNLEFGTLHPKYLRLEDSNPPSGRPNTPLWSLMCWQIKYCCWPGVPAIPLTRGRGIDPARLLAHNVAEYRKQSTVRVCYVDRASRKSLPTLEAPSFSSENPHVSKYMSSGVNRKTKKTCPLIVSTKTRLRCIGSKRTTIIYSVPSG
jgi:hypothetical protein